MRFTKNQHNDIWMANFLGLHRKWMKKFMAMDAAKDDRKSRRSQRKFKRRRRLFYAIILRQSNMNWYKNVKNPALHDYWKRIPLNIPKYGKARDL